MSIEIRKDREPSFIYISLVFRWRTWWIATRKFYVIVDTFSMLRGDAFSRYRFVALPASRSYLRYCEEEKRQEEHCPHSKKNTRIFGDL